MILTFEDSEEEILNHIISCVSAGSRAYQVVENEKKNLSFNGLEIDDINRSVRKQKQEIDVKTLSGGESFMAALSMALGMADVIQNTAGKVRMDTMFVDEGFGSLDDESREEAIKILNELAGDRRLVGIISHVTELKEQIDRKLVVAKDEKGSKVYWAE